MVDITKEMLSCLKAFQNQFGDVVPLRELPQSVNTEDLIAAIKLSIQNNENLLPKMFGYGKLENNPDMTI